MMIKTIQTLEVVTRGISGENWFTRLRTSGYNLGGFVEEMLCSKDFVTTNGTTFRLAIVGGDEYENNERREKTLKSEIIRCKYLVPPAEISPYLRELFSDEDLESMGLMSLVVMHKPIKVSCDGTFSSKQQRFELIRRVRGRSPNRFWNRSHDEYIEACGFVYQVT